MAGACWAERVAARFLAPTCGNEIFLAAWWLWAKNRPAVKTLPGITWPTFWVIAVTSCLLRAGAEAGCEIREGGIIRAQRDAKRIAPAFTGHSFAEGGEVILSELAQHKARGSFFFTGEFYANTNFAALIQRIAKDGHYLGPHSDKHLLYCPWDGPKTSLVSRVEFRADLETNLKKIEHFGVKRSDIRYFLPPYEHYNEEIVAWTAELDMKLINYTPGTRSNADYTGEADKNFVSSQVIFDSILKKERDDPNGLNGFILLLHIGAGPGRADKFHTRFGELLDVLAAKGYQFVSVDELLEPKESK